MNSSHLPAPTMNAASSGGEFHSARYAGQLHIRRKVKVATRLKEPTRLKDMVVTRLKARREAIRHKDRREATRLKAIRHRAATRRSP
jgi:hypothetical protein